MSIEKLPTGRWQVRWRDETGQQRARNFPFRQEAKAFDDEVRAAKLGLAPPPLGAVAKRPMPTFGEVVDAWKARRYPALAAGTLDSYDKLLRLHFDPLLALSMSDLTPKALDGWIAWLVAGRDRFGKGRLRVSFRAELALLRAILNDFGEHRDEDDAPWVSPLKQRHKKAIRLAAPKPKRKDLSEEELGQLRAALLELDFRGRGRVHAALAAVQYWQALRISEAAALRWSDLRLDRTAPAKSRLTVSQHVVYLRAAPSFIAPGTKNGPLKEQPVLPQTFLALAELWTPTARGLVFKGEAGAFLAYREVQYAYDRAFKRAGLPYTATHVMRHGGTRTVLEDTGGDRDIARQQLGNRDGKTVEVYAQRSAAAFTRYAEKKWRECASSSAFERAGLKLVKES